MKVIIYTPDYCGYCKRAKALLSQKGIAFEEINVEGDDEKRAWLIEQTGQRTVPQIFINEKSIGGYDELSALDRSGKLDQIIQKIS